jgi:hypothetical protein
MVSKSGTRFVASSSSSLARWPSLPIAYSTGKSVCASDARGRRRGRTPRQHLVGAGVLAVDLVDDHDDGEAALEALRSTKRVCGSGPSAASTSSSAPSAIMSVRSTSPPKSAWPGVSTMLIL